MVSGVRAPIALNFLLMPRNPIRLDRYSVDQQRRSPLASGQLLYNASDFASQLAWFDRAGELLARLGEENDYGDPFRLSPDGRRAAATRDRPGGSDLWLLDLDLGSSSRFTSASAEQDTQGSNPQ